MTVLRQTLPLIALLGTGCTDPLAGSWLSHGSVPNVGRYVIEVGDDLVGTIDFSDRARDGGLMLQGAVEAKRVDRDDGVWRYELRVDGQLEVTCGLVRTTDVLNCNWRSVSLVFAEVRPDDEPPCHDVCIEGAPLGASCGSCAGAVCAADAYCCGGAWDGTCTSLASVECPEVLCGP